MYRTNFDEKNKLWSNCELPPMFNPHASIGQLMLRALTMHGSKVAQISDDTGIRMSFAEILLKTIRAAQNLIKRGYKSKQVFGFMNKNSHQLSSILFAAFCLGCPINPVYYLSRKDELIRLFGKSKPSVVFCDVENYGVLKEALRELQNDAKIFTFNGHIDDSEPVQNLFVETGVEKDFIPQAVDGVNDAAAIMCSSGTTGTSKSIQLSHANLINAMTCGMANADDILLCFSTIYWGCGLCAVIIGTFCGATRIITEENGAAELYFRLIQRYKVTLLINDPHELALILKSDLINQVDLSSVSKQLVVGSRMSPDMKIELESYLPNATVHSVYGITELAGFVSMSVPGGSVGRLLLGSRVKIVDKNGSRCGIGVRGEICVKLSNKIIGYLNDEKATRAAFDDEGYFLTGDLGHFDVNGSLHISERKIHMLLYRGNWIIPSDIEDVVLKLPGIEMVCVVGIPNDTTTESPAAVIVRCKNSTTHEENVHNIVTNYLPDYMKLRGGVYFVDSLPFTPSGKIKRGEVLKIAIELFQKKDPLLISEIEANFS